MVWVAGVLAIARVSLLVRVRRSGSDVADQFRAVIDQAPTAIVVFDADTVLYANRRVVRLIGTEDPDSVMGRSFDEVLSPETASVAREGYANIIETNEVVRVKDFPVTGRNGVVVRCDLTFVPIESEGRPAVQGAFVSVDEKHEAEAALRETEERFRRFFEELPVPMYRTRVDGTILDANAALARMLAVEEASSLRGINATSFYAEEGERERLAAIQRDQGLLEDQLSLLVASDGRTLWVRDSSHTVTDEDGQIFEGALIDVTQAQRATHELRVRARQQQALAHIGQAALQSPDIADVLTEAVERIDAECAVLAEALEDGLEVTAISYRVDSTLRREGALDYIERHFGDGLARGGTVILPSGDEAGGGGLSGVMVGISGSTEYYGLIGVCGADLQISDEDETFLLASAAMLGSALERSRSRARLQRLIRSKDEFVASVSHELRTPLTVVAGLALELENHWRGFSEQEIAEFISLIAD